MQATALDTVRRHWVLFREGGSDAALATVAPNAAFVAVGGRRFDGHDGIRAFFATFDARDEQFTASPFTFEPHGDGVLVAGHRRVSDGTSTVSAEHLHFTYCVGPDGLIYDMRAFPDRDGALAELAHARPREP